MLFEVYKAFKSDEWARQFSQWTEGFYELPKNPTPQDEAIWGWLTSSRLNFRGFSPMNTNRDFKEKWGKLKIPAEFGPQLAVASIGDHNANLDRYIGTAYLVDTPIYLYL